MKEAVSTEAAEQYSEYTVHFELLCFHSNKPLSAMDVYTLYKSSIILISLVGEVSNLNRYWNVEVGLYAELKVF